MANSPRDNLAHWLRDAHSMEVGTLDDLRRLASRIESYPQLKARIEQHIQESEGQERRLKELLESMGESTSALKETVTKLAGNVQALVGTFFSDEEPVAESSSELRNGAAGLRVEGLTRGQRRDSLRR